MIAGQKILFIMFSAVCQSGARLQFPTIRTILKVGLIKFPTLALFSRVLFIYCRNVPCLCHSLALLPIEVIKSLIFVDWKIILSLTTTLHERNAALETLAPFNIHVVFFVVFIDIPAEEFFLLEPES